MHCRSSCGNPFQIRGPVTEKRRRPNAVAVRGTVNRSMQEERRDRTGSFYGLNKFICFVRQIKLARRHLLGARKYSASYHGDVPSLMSRDC